MRSCILNVSDLADDAAVNCYLDRYSDLRAAFGTNLTAGRCHWMNYGQGDPEYRTFGCAETGRAAGSDDRQKYGCLGMISGQKPTTSNGVFGGGGGGVTTPLPFISTTLAWCAAFLDGPGMDASFGWAPDAHL